MLIRLKCSLSFTLYFFISSLLSPGTTPPGGWCGYFLFRSSQLSTSESVLSSFQIFKTRNPFPLKSCANSDCVLYSFERNIFRFLVALFLDNAVLIIFHILRSFDNPISASNVRYINEQNQ